MTTQQEVASWAKKAREAAARRDDAMRRMQTEGASLRAIAEAAGVSHQTVKNILARGDLPPRKMQLNPEPLKVTKDLDRDSVAYITRLLRGRSDEDRKRVWVMFGGDPAVWDAEHPRPLS